MRLWIAHAVFALVLCLAGHASAKHSDLLDSSGRAPRLHSVNAVLGDASFIARFGRPPSAADPERLRVATHLEFVEALLRSRDASGLSAALQRARAQNLDRLREYRQRGVFPRNTERPGRSPRFIDHEGRICAAGYLVERSAGRATAEAIRARHEHELIEHMSMPELDAWIAQSGLTRLEVAMIQPGYGFRPVEPTELTVPQVTLAIRSATARVDECVARHHDGSERFVLRAAATLRAGRAPAVEMAATVAITPALRACVRQAVLRSVTPLARRQTQGTLRASHDFRFPSRTAQLSVQAAEDVLTSALPELVRCTLPSPSARTGRITVVVTFTAPGAIGEIRTLVPPDNLEVATCLRDVVARLTTPAFRGKSVEATLTFQATVKSRVEPPATSPK